MVLLRLHRHLRDVDKRWVRPVGSVRHTTAWLRSAVSTRVQRHALGSAQPHQGATLGRLTDVEVLDRLAALVVAGRLVVVEREMPWWTPAAAAAAEPDFYLGPAPVEEEDWGRLVVEESIDPPDDAFFHLEAEIEEDEPATLLAEAEVTDAPFDDDEGGLQIEDELHDEDGDGDGDLEIHDQVEEHPTPA